MFGFPSLAKIAVLIGVIGAVWYGFKWISKLKQAREAERRVRGQPSFRDGAAQETVRCRVCDSYVPRDMARDCGRDGCPHEA